MYLVLLLVFGHPVKALNLLLAHVVDYVFAPLILIAATAERVGGVHALASDRSVPCLVLPRLQGARAATHAARGRLEEAKGPCTASCCQILQAFACARSYTLVHDIRVLAPEAGVEEDTRARHQKRIRGTPAVDYHRLLELVIVLHRTVHQESL